MQLVLEDIRTVGPDDVRSDDEAGAVCARLAAQPGALLALDYGGALSEVLSRPGTHGGACGMHGRVIFLATLKR